jgi:hypothetical protein
MRFGFMLNMNPKGYGFESPSGPSIIFQIKYTKSVKSMLKSVESTESNIEQWDKTIFIEFTSQNRWMYAFFLWVIPELPNFKNFGQILKFQNFYLEIKWLEMNLFDLNGSSGSIVDLKPKGPGFESRIRQGYICWWCGSKRSGCV